MKQYKTQIAAFLLGLAVPFLLGANNGWWSWRQAVDARLDKIESTANRALRESMPAMPKTATTEQWHRHQRSYGVTPNSGPSVYLDPVQHPHNPKSYAKPRGAD